MRKIKFRAWDKFRKKLITNILTIKMHRVMEQPCLIVYTDKKINPHLEIKEIDKIYCNEFELMQFVGLKDKNGVEIYEGDIISNGVGKFTVTDIRVDYSVLGCFLDDIEVIGNIYENKDLIENET